MFVFRDVLLSARTSLRCSLSRIYGIGFSRASYIADLLGFSQSFRMNEVGYSIFGLVLFVLRNSYITGEVLKHRQRTNQRQLVDVGCYKGLRHKCFLPVRGQRTRTNARIRKKLNPRYGNKNM